MKRINCVTLLGVLVMNLLVAKVWAQGTAFAYQGQLDSGGGPASGSYDFTFTLYPVSSNGVAMAAPVTNLMVGVSNGLFKPELRS